MQQILLILTTLLLCSPAVATESQLLSHEEAIWLQNHPAPFRIHNERDWLPFNFYEEGQPRGYSIDYMNLVAEKIGLDIEYVSGPSWSEFLEMMKDGSLDIMVNIASTKKRREYLSFTEPYYITKTALFVRNNETKITDLNDLTGKKIGFTKGFFFSEFLQKSYPAIEIVTFDSTLDSFIGVENGLVDAAIEIPVVGQRILNEGKVSGIKLGGFVTDPRFITTFYIATQKDNHLLKSILQKGIDAITPEEELLIRQKWKIEEMAPDLITREEKTYLAQRDTLQVCVNPNHLPLEALNIDGTVTGISSEFLKLLGDRMNIDFTVIPTKNWDETLSLAEKGDCDLLPMIAKTSELHEFLNFTSPWLRTPIVVVTRQDQIYISHFDQVTDRTFGVVKGGATVKIIHLNYPKLRLVNVDSIQQGLRMVENKMLFGFIDTIPSISRALQSDSITNVKISGNVGLNVAFSIGVRKGDTTLLNIVSKSISAINSNEISNIYNRWLAVAYIDRFNYRRLWQVIGIFAILIAYLLHRYRQGLKITERLKQAHSDIEEINLQLTEQARTDPLTGIANRLKIDESIQMELARFKRTREHFSIILIDIDNFKQVNDTYGHHIGDQALISIATILEQNTRSYDLVGRWGGEEFLIVCPCTTHDGIMSLAEHLRLAVMNNREENLPPQTASFGVATIQEGDSDIDLISRADNALYRAKRAGRNRVES